MLQQQTPIGELIFYLRHNPDDFLPNGKHMSDQIDQLLHEVKLTTKKYGVDQASDDLKHTLFGFRVELISFFLREEISLQDIKDTLTKRLSGSYFEINYPDTVREAFRNTLEKYLEIMDGMAKQEEATGIEVKERSGRYQKQNKMPSSYDEVIATLNYFSPLDDESLKHWFNAGLTLDYAFILSEMYFEKEIDLSRDNKRSLASLLYNSVEDIGVYAHHFNIWAPQEKDESQLNRNIKIRIATQDVLSGHTNTCSLEELKQLF